MLFNSFFLLKPRFGLLLEKTAEKLRQFYLVDRLVPHNRNNHDYQKSCLQFSLQFYNKVLGLTKAWNVKGFSEYTWGGVALFLMNIWFVFDYLDKHRNLFVLLKHIYQQFWIKNFAEIIKNGYLGIRSLRFDYRIVKKFLKETKVSDQAQSVLSIMQWIQRVRVQLQHTFYENSHDTVFHNSTKRVFIS